MAIYGSGVAPATATAPEQPSWAAQLGAFMSDPNIQNVGKLLGSVAQVYGQYGNPAVRGDAMLKLLQNAAQGPTVAKVAGSTPVSTAPQKTLPAPKKTEIKITTQDLNNNGVPDSQEGGAQKAPASNTIGGLSSQPGLTDTLTPASFSTGAEVNAGTSAPVPTSIVPAVVPVPQTNTTFDPSAFVHSVNVAQPQMLTTDAMSLAGSYGPDGLLKLIQSGQKNAVDKTNAQTQLLDAISKRISAGASKTSADASVTAANASYVKAITDAGELEIKLTKLQPEVDKLKADTKQAIASADEMNAKRTGTQAYSPEQIAKVEGAKEEAKKTAAAKMEKIELAEYLKSPGSKMPLPDALVKAQKLPYKTYGEMAMALGSKAKMEDALSESVKLITATITANGITAGQEIQALNALRDAQHDDLQNATRMLQQLQSPMVSLMVPKTEVAQNAYKADVAYWSDRAKNALDRLGKTEQSIIGLGKGTNNTPAPTTSQASAVPKGIPAGSKLDTTRQTKDGFEVWIGPDGNLYKGNKRK